MPSDRLRQENLYKMSGRAGRAWQQVDPQGRGADAIRLDR
jgi:hypothetical protein